MKQCTRCKLFKPEISFSFRNTRPRSHCKSCVSEVSLLAQKRRREEDPEGWRKYKANSKRSQIRRRFGLDDFEFNKLLEFQNWRCAICQVEIAEKPYLDHDHTSGLVRGLLCFHCNVGLGHFRDSRVLLSNAVLYLERNGV